MIGGSAIDMLPSVHGATPMRHPTVATWEATETAQRQSRPTAALRVIAHAASDALYDELALAPKPGLVSFVDSGSHTDMNAQTFMRSIHALRPYFAQITYQGYSQTRFAALQASGLAAEARMLDATGGVNTHRGAIFTLGLLCASAGALLREDRRLSPTTLRDALQRHWGDALHRRCTQASGLPGNCAHRRYGLSGAALQAARGFPALFDTVLPALISGLSRGLPANQARLDALFHAMAVLDDTNLAHRGGLPALRRVQRKARVFLHAGGASRPGGIAAAWNMHHELVRDRLSPGGAADMLAAACWIVRVAVISETGPKTAASCDTG